MKRLVMILLVMIMVMASSSVYAYDNDFETHFALEARDIGPCRKLVGKTEILLAFVSTPDHPWTDDKKQEVFDVSDSSVQIMKDEALRYGNTLELSYYPFEFSIPMEFSKDYEWYDYLLQNDYKVQNMDVIQQRYRRSLHVDSAPIIFLFNSWDRSYSRTTSAQNASFEDECSIIFCDTDMHDNYLTHELLHQFGAIDYYDYDNEGVENVAKKYFPESDMLIVSHDIDELTAFLVGWTDEIGPNAEAFLKETDGLR